MSRQYPGVMWRPPPDLRRRYDEFVRIEQRPSANAAMNYAMGAFMDWWERERKPTMARRMDKTASQD